MTSGIAYGVYASTDADAMTTLLGDAFSRRDPPAVAIGLTAADFEAFVRVLCPRVAEDGLTIVARRVDTGEIVGALLAEDCASPPPAGMDALTPKFDPIFDILGQLEAEYRRGVAAQPGESLHLYLLGVAEQVAGRGVAHGLVSAAVAHGARRGYRMAVTAATNPVSQHIFRKLGFTERVRRSYAAHLFDDRAPFASIAGHGGPALMDLPITLGHAV